MFLFYFFLFFFFNDTATTEIYTLSLHDALPIFFTFQAISYVVDVKRRLIEPAPVIDLAIYLSFFPHLIAGPIDRKSTRLNSSHANISYAVFCLKKKKKKTKTHTKLTIL